MPGLNANARVSYAPIGERNRRVTLSSSTVTTDAMGGRSETWSDYGKAWAKVAAQPFVVSETEASVLYIIEIPYREDVAEGHRVTVQGMTLKVLAVVNPELRNKALQLHCSTVTA